MLENRVLRKPVSHVILTLKHSLTLKGLYILTFIMSYSCKLKVTIAGIAYFTEVALCFPGTPGKHR